MGTWQEKVREPGAIPKMVPLLKGFGFSKEDVEDIESRFSPYASFNQHHPLDIWALMGYVAEGAFLMKRLPPYTPKRSVDRIWVKAHYPESGHHRYLKQLATRWLRVEKKVRKVEYEREYPGGISDVSSADRKWFVECGCSRPSKIWDTFRQEGSIHRKIVLFNAWNITIFEAGPNIKEYLRISAFPTYSILPTKAMEEFSALVMGPNPDIRRT